MDTNFGLGGTRHIRARRVAVLMAIGLVTLVLGLAPMRTGAASQFAVNGDEISSWWWLRDGAGQQSAHWSFDEIPAAGSVSLLFDLLATDQVDGGPGVDARFWLEYGPIVDGDELEATTAPLLMALPNISPTDDPLRYATRACYGFPVEALRLSALDAQHGPRASERGAAPGSAVPDVDGLWLTIGRLGPDGSVISEHIAVREASVQLAGGSCAGSTGGGDVTADESPGPEATPEATPEPTLEPTPEPTPTPGPSGPPEGTPTVVSIGDSFISGEGGRWAGNTTESYTRTDALGFTAYDDIPGGEMIAGCHRSRSAEIHIGANQYGPDVDSINLACSGATTETRDVGDDYKPGIDLCPAEAYCPDDVLKGQATMLHEVALEHNVDLVVLSIGGNDFEFSSTVEQCGKDFMFSSYIDKDYCKDDGSVLARFTELNITLVKQRLALAYDAVFEAMSEAGYDTDDWTLLVQTYPSPLPLGDDIRYTQVGYTRYSEGGCPFWDADADWANATALDLINDTIREAVAELDQPNVAILDVSELFVGHRLCEEGVDLLGEDRDVQVWTDSDASDGSEWVAQIRGIFSQGGLLELPGSVYDMDESFHPNYWGQLALRNCLRQAYNGGDIRGGTCAFMQDGLNDRSEPQVILTPEGRK